MQCSEDRSQPSDPGPLEPALRELLLDLAAASIRQGLLTGRPLQPEVEGYPGRLQQVQASFVTLRKRGVLRGCLGSPAALRPLVTDVAANAYHAAFGDPRFPPLEAEEIDDLTMSIAVLSPLELIPDATDPLLKQVVQPGVHGLLLRYKGRQSLLLPAVWSHLPDPVEFLRQLKKKADLHPDFESANMRYYRFTAEQFSRP